MPSRELGPFLRGALVGGVVVAALLGPDWLSTQLARGGEFKNDGKYEGWRHLADIIGLYRVIQLLASAMLGPLRQWIAMFFLCARLFIMLGVVSAVREPIRALMRGAMPHQWLHLDGRALAQSYWLGFAIVGSILASALLMVLPLESKALQVGLTTRDRLLDSTAPATCARSWQSLFRGSFGASRRVQCSSRPSARSADGAVAPPLALLIPSFDFGTALQRLRFTRAEADPVGRLILQMSLSMLILPASALGDAFLRDVRQLPIPCAINMLQRHARKSDSAYRHG